MPSVRTAESGSDGRFALRLEAARAIRDDFGITGMVEDCALSRLRLEDLGEQVTPERLSMVLRNGKGRLGLAVYSPELALALLEWRLLGILASEAAAPRSLTATDAAILADLTDPLLSRFGAAMAALPGGDWAAGYAQGNVIEDVRHLPLILAQCGYHGYRLTLKLGEGLRGGELFLALPESAQPEQQKTPEKDSAPWPEALRSGVLGAELVLNAVLWRTRLSAAEIGRLRPGDLVPMPATALGAVRLEGPGRVVITEGRLGQANGERAVKIAGPDEDQPGLSALSAAPDHGAPPPGFAPEEEDSGFPLATDFPAMADLPDETDFPAMADFPAMGDFDAEESDFGFDFPAMAQN
ncbi:flagellar motor switch protein FliM [Rhodovulum strictum]